MRPLLFMLYPGGVGIRVLDDPLMAGAIHCGQRGPNNNQSTGGVVARKNRYRAGAFQFHPDSSCFLAPFLQDHVHTPDTAETPPTPDPDPDQTIHSSHLSASRQLHHCPCCSLLLVASSILLYRVRVSFYHLNVTTPHCLRFPSSVARSVS